MLRMSMVNTDSVWKHELAEAQEAAGSPVRLTPFRSFQADCPYLVGDHDTVAGHIASMTDAGVRTMVMDAPGSKEDFGHLAEVVRRLRAGAVPGGAR
jgi:alkanesulfonate monooxygenase